MIQFKEIAFIRLKRQAKSAQNPTRSKLEQIRAALRGLLDWSIVTDRHQINEVYMNYENKAIYNNGLVIRRLENGEFQVELVTSVPREACTTTLGTPFRQPKNFINFSYERSTFYSNPVLFFQSLGYKIQNNFQYKEVESYKSLTFGLEVILFPKHAYLQIIESYHSKPEMDNYQSAGHQLIKALSAFLDETAEVILSSGNMKPQDFLQEYS